ncbi:hypothetical protein BS78_01G268200 [Paspalum vaginatum]|nr:hypothetical protein BS78_01G268200 [Paspalum vaginatum]
MVRLVGRLPSFGFGLSLVAWSIKAFCGFPLLFLMNHKAWIILNWNIKVLNAKDKWDKIREKIDESNCSIICIQETKRPMIDSIFVTNFAPKRFDKFDYSPSDGALGGILLLWNSALFDGTIIQKGSYAIHATFTSVHNLTIWNLVNVYGPCREPGRSEFIYWLKALEINDDSLWLLLGDYDFYRLPDDRNKLGGSYNDMLIFNDAINSLGLIELPIQGRTYSWSNMQANPLLEQLDWFFSSVNWTVSFPNTTVIALAKNHINHLPCKLVIDIKIPKANLFMFENFWVECPGFLATVSAWWNKHFFGHRSAASSFNAKLKNVRFELKKWSKRLSNLKTLISNCNKVIFCLDALENYMPLFFTEWNLRSLVQLQQQKLLKAQNIYWKQRHTLNRILFGDECTKYFHSMATINHKKTPSVKSLLQMVLQLVIISARRVFYCLLLRLDWVTVITQPCSMT